MLDANQQKLLAETKAFYNHVASDFSRTRSEAWPGWRQLLPHLPNASFSLLDVAAGNCRFERYLASEGYQFSATAIDTCAPLVEPAPNTQVKLVDPLLTPLAKCALPADVVVSFGFLHHIPKAASRLQFLKDLLSRVKPGGIAAVSLWQLAHDPRIAKKAEAVTTRFLARHPDITLDAHDYLLGWRDQSEVFRFCHHFEDAEVAELAAAATQNLHNISLIASYKADGKTNNLNHYLLFSAAP